MSIRKLLTSAMLVGVTFSASSVPVQADPVTIESTGVVFWPGFRAGDVLRVSFDMRGPIRHPRWTRWTSSHSPHS